MCRSCSQASICCWVCRTNRGWHLEFKAKTVTNIPSLPGTASFFMLCDMLCDNTHLYLMVPDMPRAITEVRSTGEAAPSPEDCPLRQFCHGNSMVSTISDTLLATVHAPPPPVWVSFFAMYSFRGSAGRSARDPHFSATRGRVVWCTLVPPQTPLLDYRMAQYCGWITLREKQSSRVSKLATPKKGKHA